MLSLSKHGGQASARVLRQAQDDSPSTPNIFSGLYWFMSPHL